MNAQERLQFYLNESIKSVSDKRYRKVSEALVEVLPSFVKALHETILDPQATKSSRALALSMLNSLIIRMESSKRRPQKTRKPKPLELMTAEQFIELLRTHLPKIDDDTAERLRAVLAAANQRYHGQRLG